MILSKREQLILSYSQTNGMHTLLVRAVGYTHRLSLKIITYLIYICISNSNSFARNETAANQTQSSANNSTG